MIDNNTFYLRLNFRSMEQDLLIGQQKFCFIDFSEKRFNTRT